MVVLLVTIVVQGKDNNGCNSNLHQLPLERRTVFKRYVLHSDMAKIVICTFCFLDCYSAHYWFTVIFIKDTRVCNGSSPVAKVQ